MDCNFEFGMQEIRCHLLRLLAVWVSLTTLMFVTLYVMNVSDTSTNVMLPSTKYAAYVGESALYGSMTDVCFFITGGGDTSFYVFFFA